LLKSFDLIKIISIGKFFETEKIFCYQETSFAKYFFQENIYREYF